MTCRPERLLVLGIAAALALAAPGAAVPAQPAATAPQLVEEGRAHYRAGRHDLALAVAIEAVEAGPSDPRAQEFRGQLLRDAEGLPAALAWFESALKNVPDDIGLLGEYAATLGDAGRNRDMLRIARRMVEIDPRHPRAYFLQAVLAARAGQDDLARRLLWRTGGAYERLPAGQLLAGALDLRTGNAALAVDRFDALSRQQPDNTMAAELLGKALLINGEANEVIARMGALADRPDASPYLLTLVGRAHERLGHRDVAARYLDRAALPVPMALSALPAHEAAWRAAGAAMDAPGLRRMLEQGRRGEAVSVAARLATRYRGSADVGLLAGDTALLAGDPAAALARYGHVAVVRSDFALVERMVVAQRLLGRWDAARTSLADYLLRHPRSAPAAAMLGRVHAEQGRWREAAAMLDYARKLGGGDRDPLLLADYATSLLMSGQTGTAGDVAYEAYGLQRANARVTVVLARVMEAREPSSGPTAAVLAKASQFTAPTAVAAR